MNAAALWFLVILINGVPMATGPYERAECLAKADMVERPDPERPTAWCVHRDRVDLFRDDPDYGLVV